MSATATSFLPLRSRQASAEFARRLADYSWRKTVPLSSGQFGQARRTNQALTMNVVSLAQSGCGLASECVRICGPICAFTLRLQDSGSVEKTNLATQAQAEGSARPRGCAASSELLALWCKTSPRLCVLRRGRSARAPIRFWRAVVRCPAALRALIPGKGVGSGIGRNGARNGAKRAFAAISLNHRPWHSPDIGPAFRNVR